MYREVVSHRARVNGVLRAKFARVVGKIGPFERPLPLAQLMLFLFMENSALAWTVQILTEHNIV